MFNLGGKQAPRGAEGEGTTRRTSLAGILFQHQGEGCTFQGLESGRAGWRLADEVQVGAGGTLRPRVACSHMHRGARLRLPPLATAGRWGSRAVTALLGPGSVKVVAQKPQVPAKTLQQPPHFPGSPLALRAPGVHRAHLNPTAGLPVAILQPFSSVWYIVGAR